MRARPEEFRAHAAECEDLANWYGDLIKDQYEQLARQWRSLADQAETDQRRPLIVGDPVLLCTVPRLVP